MNTVIKHIEYLLLHNDCVIIPQLGAILSKRECAVYDSKNNVITPPRRVFTFNDSIINDDKALLASSIVRALRVTRPEADQIIANDVRVIKNHIFRRGILKIGKTGTMLVDENTRQIYFFEAPAYSNACTMWLEPVNTGNAATKVIDAPIEHNTWSWRSLKRVARAAASVAILLGVCFLASTPIHIDEVVMASLAPEIKPVENVDLVPQQNLTPATTDNIEITTIVDNTESDNLATDNAEADDVSDDTATIETADTTTDSSLSVATPKYHLIIATFSTKEQAESFISKNPGRNYQIIGKSKLFRISGGSFMTKNEASKACSNSQTQYPGSWIYSE